MKEVQTKDLKDIRSGDILFFTDAPTLRGYVKQVEGFALRVALWDVYTGEVTEHLLAAFVILPKIEKIQRWAIEGNI